MIADFLAGNFKDMVKLAIGTFVAFLIAIGLFLFVVICCVIIDDWKKRRKKK